MSKAVHLSKAVPLLPLPKAQAKQVKAAAMPSPIPPAPSSSSAPKPVPTSACMENNPKAGFSCSWDGYAVGSVLTPGRILKPAVAILPSGCTSVAWKYAPDTSGLVLNYECASIDESGFSALGSRNYVLFAELTCDDGKHTNACNPKAGWSSKMAPELSGTCAWSKNPTTTARGGTPSGVSIVDVDKVCSSPTIEYKYDGGTKTWPANGILSEWKNWDKKHKETYSDVEATLKCPAYGVPVTVLCPPLEVSAGSDHIIECTCPGNEQCQPTDYTICKADGVQRSNSVTLNVDECVEVSIIGYDYQYYLPNLIMRCETQGGQQSVSVTLSLNGTPRIYTGSYAVLPEVGLGKIHVGDNEFGTLCLTAISGATSVKCKGPSQ